MSPSLPFVTTHSRGRLAAISIAAALLLPPGASAETLIDAFETPALQSASSAVPPGSTGYDPAPGAWGGSRRLSTLAFSTATTAISAGATNGGVLTTTFTGIPVGDPGVTYGLVGATWSSDGTSSPAFTVDLTEGGTVDRFKVDLVTSDVPSEEILFGIQVVTNGSLGELAHNGGAGTLVNGSYEFAFSDFTLDFDGSPTPIQEFTAVEKVLFAVGVDETPQATATFDNLRTAGPPTVPALPAPAAVWLVFALAGVAWIRRQPSWPRGRRRAS